jgi:hypothetical protein
VDVPIGTADQASRLTACDASPSANRPECQRTMTGAVGEPNLPDTFLSSVTAGRQAAQSVRRGRDATSESKGAVLVGSAYGAAGPPTLSMVNGTPALFFSLLRFRRRSAGLNHVANR